MPLKFGWYLLSALLLFGETLQQTVANSTSDLIPDYFGVKIQDGSGTTTMDVPSGNPFWIRYSTTYTVTTSNLGM